MLMAKREGSCEWERIAGEYQAAVDPSMWPAKVEVEPCDAAIEARRVCRRHYPKLKKLMALSPRTPTAKRAAGDAVATIEQVGSSDGKTKVARVVDIRVWLDYAQSEKDVRKKDMKAGTVWKGVASVDMKAGSRLTPEEIRTRHEERLAAFEAQLPKGVTLIQSQYDRRYREQWRPLFMRDVIEQEAGDWREHYGYDRVHARREQALRSIDVATAAKKLGLEPDLGDQDIVRQIVEAIEDGRIKS